MKKLFMAAAALTLMMTMTVLTSCTDNDNNPVTPPADATEQPTQPTEDALAVKFDGNYVVYGKLEDGMAAALQRRLQGNMTSPMDADCFVFNPSTIEDTNISTEEWKYMASRCMSGEASVVLTQCTFKDFYYFGMAYVLAVMNIVLENYNGDTDAEAVAEARAQAKRQMANIVRNAYIAVGGVGDAVTRGTEVNGLELDWEHIDQWPEEKQNTTMFDAYALCGGNEIYVLNAEACRYLNEEVPQQPDNDYEWGQKADAIAAWMNRHGKDDAESRSGLAGFTRAVTRAGGSTAISDLMNAQTKEFVFDYKYPSLFNTSVETAYSAIKVQYSVYGAYDFSGNVEYYQVRQNITVMNDKLFIDPGDGWWPRSNDGRWTLARGAYMKRIDTKMWLEGSGTKSVVSAAPLNENGSSSGSSSSGGGTTHTEGGSDGYSIGGSAGMSGLNPTFSISGSYSHTKTYSDATSTTWNTSTNWCTKDLTTTFTQGNDANATVTWKHTGYTPTNGNDAHVSKLKPLLRSTCVTDEQTLWKVQNPSGSYTLRANLNVVAEIYKIAWTGSGYDGNLPTQDNLIDISFDLTAPDRYKKMWNNVIYNYGSLATFSEKRDFNQYINENYGAGSANFCWAALFTSTEATKDGSENARAVFQTFKNSIHGMKQALRAMNVEGELVFGLKLDGKEELVDSVKLNLNQSYNVGETFLENVNGYDLTFKVTKTNQEVELIDIPENYQGELVIPSVIEGKLKVTSLGAFCAQDRSEITSVTIPGTVSNIGDGAFSNTDKLKEMHVKATMPPTVYYWTFYPTYSKDVLYVPKNCAVTYYHTMYWVSGFSRIVEE